MKFINTLEENGGVFGEGGGARKVALGSWLNPTRGRGPAWASACAWAGGGPEGRREAQTGPVNQELRPLGWGGGAEAGQACVWRRGGLEL